MAGYGRRGEEQVPCEENTVWMEVDQGSALPVMFAPDLQPEGPATTQEVATMRQNMQDHYASWKNKLEAAEKRQEELLKEIEAGKEREKELLQQRTKLEKTVDEWTRLYYKALSSYDDMFFEEITDREKKHAEVVEGLQSELAELEEDKVELRKALEEHRGALDDLRSHHESSFKFVSESVIRILWEVTQWVRALTVDVEKSQLGNKFQRPKTTSLRTKPRLDMPMTMASSVEEAKKMIDRAQAALIEAAKKWKKNQDGLEVMISYCREDLLDRIMGREELASETKAALRDIPNETQTMEQRPQMKQKSLAALELKERNVDRPNQLIAPGNSSGNGVQRGLDI